MLRSMTGFGSASGVVDSIEYTVEIRTVNNRYFKAVIKLPESWSAIEPQIDQLLRKKLSRGSITLSLRMRIPDDKAASRVNVAALNSYLDQLRVIEVDTNPTLRIDLGAMLQLPGVCEPPSIDELLAGTQDGLMKLIDQALDSLMKMRHAEGLALKEDLLSNCRVIQDNLAIVAKRAPEVVKEYQVRLAARVAELTNAAKIELDNEQLVREVAIFAERSDVAEEISRLTTHVLHFTEAIGSPEPAGRKLDFIAQEMLREANTIASKSSDADIARAVVEIKTAIDRIKEQAANVE